MGSDGQSINWKCLAELDSSVKFGTINVNCEGFLSPEDEYVLAGSCGLEYELDFTAKGKHDNYQATGSDTESGGGGAFVFFVIIALVAAYIIYSCNTSEETQRPPVIPYRHQCGPSQTTSKSRPQPLAQLRLLHHHFPTPLPGDLIWELHLL